jgi:hypothetical protein
MDKVTQNSCRGLASAISRLDGSLGSRQSACRSRSRSGPAYQLRDSPGDGACKVDIHKTHRIRPRETPAIDPNITCKNLHKENKSAKCPPHELFLDLGCCSFALLLRVARSWYHNTRNGAAKWEGPEFKSLEITIYRKKSDYRRFRACEFGV